MTIDQLIDALEKGTQANLQSKYRHGNLIRLSGPGQLIMTGDIHDHDRNYEKLVRFANLENQPESHLVLHELIHRGHAAMPNLCYSYRLVAQAALLKATYPDQVHYLLGNHAMAQIAREEVLKNGQPMIQAILDALREEFGSDSEKVLEVMDAFLISLPIAIRTENRIWISHSLPSFRHLKEFDDSIFDMDITRDAIANNTSLRALTWDRSHNDKCMADLKERWDVDFFLVGHQAQETGFARPHDNMIILASDHNHGHCMPIDLDKSYTPDELFALLKPIASIA